MGILRKKRMKEAPEKDTAVPDISSEDFEDILSKNRIVVVDCWNPHCLPCRKVHRMMYDMAEKYGGRMLFGKLNTDDEVEAAVRYGVMSVPTVLVFVDGEKKGAITGITTESALEADILKIAEESI